MPKVSASPLENFDKLPNSAAVPVPTAILVLGRSRATIWRWLKEGTLTAVKSKTRHTSVNVGSIRAINGGAVK